MTPELTEADDPPPDAALIAGGLEASYAGPGMWGHIYLAPSRQRAYRVIPGDQMHAALRSGIQDWSRQPQRSFAAPILPDEEATGQRQFGSRFYDVISYAIAGERTLATVLASDEAPVSRLALVAQTLRRAAEWWGYPERCLLPTADDIVVCEHGPHLLSLPVLAPPAVSSLLEAPVRAAYLSPELVRGGLPERSDDVYALAVLVLRCFYRIPAPDPADALRRAANADLGSLAAGPGRGEAWMPIVQPVTDLLEALRLLLAPDPAARRAAALDELAELLDRCQPMLDPVAAVEAVRRSGRYRQAWEITQRAIAGPTASVELLAVAAALAWLDLDRPRIGLALLERANAAIPDSRGVGDRYLKRLLTLSDAVTRDPDPAEPELRAQLARSVRIAYSQLPESDSRRHAYRVAWQLIRLGAFDEAARLLWPLINREDLPGAERLELLFAYFEVWIRARQREKAAGVLDHLRAQLDGAPRATERRASNEARLRDARQRLADLGPGEAS